MTISAETITEKQSSEEVDIVDEFAGLEALVELLEGEFWENPEEVHNKWRQIEFLAFEDGNKSPKIRVHIIIHPIESDDLYQKKSTTYRVMVQSFGNTSFWEVTKGGSAEGNTSIFTKKNTHPNGRHAYAAVTLGKEYFQTRVRGTISIT